jgi:hypothetical protein
LADGFLVNIDSESGCFRDFEITVGEAERVADEEPAQRAL